MITLIQLAEIIENGLNSVLNNDEIKFKIWANAGQESNAVRTGNVVNYYVAGNLRTTSSANEANLLVMGVNGLTLDFSIPVKPPKTNLLLTEEQLARIRDSQYPFVDLIISSINEFFQSAQTLPVINDGVTYSVSIKAGSIMTGSVGLESNLDEHVKVSVYIECYFLQGGINSKDVVISIDGYRVPFQSVTIGRSNRIVNDVYSGDNVVKNISTASAFSIDFIMPANADNTTNEMISFLTEGEPNVVHFVELQYGDGTVKNYLMMFDDLKTNAQGIIFAGFTVSLVETTYNPLLMSVPDYYQVVKFEFENVTESVVFNVEHCKAFIGGKALNIGGKVSVNLSESDFVYDEDNDCYYVYLVTDRAVNITESSVAYVVEKAV